METLLNIEDSYLKSMEKELEDAEVYESALKIEKDLLDRLCGYTNLSKSERIELEEKLKEVTYLKRYCVTRQEHKGVLRTLNTLKARYQEAMENFKKETEETNEQWEEYLDKFETYADVISKGKDKAKLQQLDNIRRLLEVYEKDKKFTEEHLNNTELPLLLQEKKNAILHHLKLLLAK